jgi:hypothetical protein
MRSLKPDRSSNVANHSPIRWAHHNRDPHGQVFVHGWRSGSSELGIREPTHRFLIGSRSAAPSRADQHKSSASPQSFAEKYSPPSHNRRMTKDQRASFLFPTPYSLFPDFRSLFPFFRHPPHPVEIFFRPLLLLVTHTDSSTCNSYIVTTQ